MISSMSRVRLDKYKLLVLPDELRMNDTLKSKLADYLQNGGKILSSGTAGVNQAQDGFVLPQWDFDFAGIDRSNASYFHLTHNDDPKVSDMDYCMYSTSGALFKADKVLAKYVKAYFDRHWDGFHGYFYTPPERETQYAAAAVNGAGNICHISFEVFKAYNKAAPYADKALVRQCLAILLPDPLLKAEGLPSTARVTLTGCSEFALLHTKVTFPEVRGRMDIIEEHVIQPAGAIVYVKGKFKGACTLPDQKPVAIKAAADGYTKVSLPEIVGYQMIKLDK